MKLFFYGWDQIGPDRRTSTISVVYLIKTSDLKSMDIINSVKTTVSRKFLNMHKLVRKPILS